MILDTKKLEIEDQQTLLIDLKLQYKILQNAKKILSKECVDPDESSEDDSDADESSEDASDADESSEKSGESSQSYSSKKP